jgi:hypothetical protein
MRARVIAIIGVCTIACATAEDVEGTIGNTNDSGLGTGGDAGTTGVGGTSASGGSGGGSPGGSGGAPSGGSAGVASGGVGGTGAGGAGGGTGGGTGGVPTGGGGGTTGCGTGEKKCGGVCVVPNPGIGCNLTDCNACPQPPANSQWFCNSGTCDFTCLNGYVKQGQTCISTGQGGTSSGGAPGGGGTGGGGLCPAPCDPSDPQAQFVCFAFCAFSGGAGLCVPGVNCCVCAS